MIKGFFFDLDGTLVDTHRANYEAYRRALEDYRVVLTFDEFKKSIGHQANIFLPWFAPDLSPEDYEQVSVKKRQYYKESARLSVLNTQLIKFIKDVKPNHTISLVTTAKRENAETVLNFHELSDLFDFIVTADDVRVSKPSPECYITALARAGLEAGEVVAFEDSEPGIEAARAAGIAVIPIRDYSL